MKKKAIKSSAPATAGTRLDQLLDAVALVLVRRQMRQYWACR
jgi:hypothetical protein